MEQSDISQRGGWWKDWKKLVKEHICIYAKPMDTDNNVVKAEVGNRDLVEVEKGGKMLDICYSVNNKYFKKGSNFS